MTSNINVFDRSLITLRRKRAADKITKHDFLLKIVAEDLSERLNCIMREFPTALDFGCHHGLVGKMIRQNNAVHDVIFLDSCYELLNQCDGTTIQADEEFLPITNQSIDLIISGLSLQYVNDLPGVLLQIRQALKPDGLFLASLLGGHTLWELREAFTIAEEEQEGGASPRVAPFADIRDCGHLLQRAGFTLPVTDTDIITVNYDSALHLMRELKAFGASNALTSRRRKPLKKQTLFRVAEIYQDKFGLPNSKIPATFEILTLTGWAPHANQQKPLKPGSAKTRLADVLNTEEKTAGEKAFFKKPK